MAYEKVFVEDAPELAKEHEITQAPTLVVLQGDNVTSVSNVSNIRKYLDEHYAN